MIRHRTVRIILHEWRQNKLSWREALRQLHERGIAIDDAAHLLART